MDPKKTTLSDWLDEWLELYKAPHMRNSSLRMFYDIVEIHLKPFFGKMNLSDVKAMDVQKLHNSLVDKGYSLSYRKKIMAVLSQALHRAIDNDLLVKSPASGIKLDNVDRATEKDTLTPKEQEKFIAHAKHYGQYGEAFMLMLASGMRIGSIGAHKG